MASTIGDHFPFGDVDQSVVDRAALVFPEAAQAPLNVMFDLGRASVRFLEMAADLLGSHGLTPARWRVIVALLFQSEEGGSTLGSLASHLGVKEPTVTTTVARLESEGLVRKEVDVRDRRVSRVTVTEAGAAKAARIIPDLATTVAHLVDAMGGAAVVAEMAARIDRACDAVGAARAGSI